MKLKIFLLFLICVVSETNVYAQDTSAHSKNAVLLGFGDLTQGEILINEHLNDSLHFISSYEDLNTWLHVSSFHLTLTCKGQILKYLENKSGNKLTVEMQDAIKKLHPGCFIIFDGIQHESLERHGAKVQFKGTLKLTLK